MLEKRDRYDDTEALRKEFETLFRGSPRTRWLIDADDMGELAVAAGRTGAYRVLEVLIKILKAKE
jgi:hypothetical protein